MTTLTLTTAQQEQTMTSRQIADITSKQHQHVKRDIEKMLEELGEDVSKFGRIYLDTMNREQTEFALNRELTETLLTGYSAPLRRAVIARWRELESGAAPAFVIPKTFADALRLAADQEETIQHQAAQIAAAAPKVAFVDQYVQATSGSRRFREVAKLLGVKENAFRDFLFAEKIMYRLHGKLAAYSQHMEAGRFEMVAGAAPHSGHSYVESMFTAKGIEWIAGEWAKHKIRGAT